MRLGLHANTNKGTRELLDYVARVKPAMVKFLECASDVIQEVHRLSPRTIVVYREYEANQNIQLYGEWLGRMKQRAPQLRAAGVNYAEGWNEMCGRDLAQMRRYASYEATFAKAMNDAGIGAAIGGYSTGFLDAAYYEPNRPIFELAHERGGSVLYHHHEYSGPYMQYMTITADGRNQWARGTPVLRGQEPGWSFARDSDGVIRAVGYKMPKRLPKGAGWTGVSPEAMYYDPTLKGYLTLRYRFLRDWLVSQGLDGVRMIVTESGIDDVQPRPGGHAKGWRDYDGTEWSRLPGIGDYAKQQYWYCWQLTQDAYVLGASDFGFGTVDPAWNSFDLLQTPAMRERVIAEMLTLPEGHVESYLLGCDVSHHQGLMDWTKCRAAGARYVWIKATEGTAYTDPQFVANAEGAREAGVLWGPYHYYHNGLDGDEQAAHFAAIVADTGYDLPPVLDLEDKSVPVSVPRLRQFCRSVAARLGRPAIYTSKSWIEWAGLTGEAWLAEYPLWVARYRTAPPDVPKPWTDWTVWQYTSSGPGKAFGAQSTTIDLNRYRGTASELAALREDEPEDDLAALLAAAQAEHEQRGIQLNPDAAIQRAILADGLNVVTNERRFDMDRVYQVGQALDGPDKWCYVWDARVGRVTRYRMA